MPEPEKTAELQLQAQQRGRHRANNLSDWGSMCNPLRSQCAFLQMCKIVLIFTCHQCAKQAKHKKAMTRAFRWWAAMGCTRCQLGEACLCPPHVHNLSPTAGETLEFWFKAVHTCHNHGQTMEICLQAVHQTCHKSCTSHHFTSPHFTSPHFTSRHLTSRHLTSLLLTSFHLTSPHFTSLPLLHGLQCATVSFFKKQQMFIQKCTPPQPPFQWNYFTLLITGSWAHF